MLKIRAIKNISVQVSLVCLSGLLACQPKEDPDVYKVEGTRIKIKYVSRINDGDWIKIGEYTIRHATDTVGQLRNENYKDVWFSVDPEDETLILMPSTTIYQKGVGKWFSKDMNNGIMTRNVIRAFMNVTKAESQYWFEGDVLSALQGHAIVTRKDGAPFEVSCNYDYQAQIEVLE